MTDPAALREYECRVVGMHGPDTWFSVGEKVSSFSAKVEMLDRSVGIGGLDLSLEEIECREARHET